MPVVPVQDVEASRAQRLERQKARFRDRGGIFVPSGKNTLVDILLSRTITGESPERTLSKRDEDDEGVSPLLSKTAANIKASAERKHRAADSECLSVNEDDGEMVVNALSRKSMATKGRVATEKKSRKVPTKKRATSIKAGPGGRKELPADKTTAAYKGNANTPSDKRARKTSRRAPSPESLDEENVSAAAPATNAKSKKGTATKRRRVVQSDGEEDGDTKTEKPIRKRMKQTTTIGNGTELNRNRQPKTLDPTTLTSAKAKPSKKRQSVQDTEGLTAKTAGQGKKPPIVLAEDSGGEGSEITYPGVAKATASWQEKPEEEGVKQPKKGLTKLKPTKGGKTKGGKNAAKMPSLFGGSEGESEPAAGPHAQKKSATMSKVAMSQQNSKANPIDSRVNPSIGPLKPKNTEETDTGQPKKRRMHADTDGYQQKRAKRYRDEDTMQLKPLKIRPPRDAARVDIPSVKQKENVVVPMRSREGNVPSSKKTKTVSKLKKPLVQKTRAKGPPKHILQRVHITAGNVPPLLVADSDPDPIDFLS